MWRSVPRSAARLWKPKIHQAVPCYALDKCAEPGSREKIEPPHDRFAVAWKHDGQRAFTRVQSIQLGRGQHVDRRRFRIELIYEAFRREVGEADAKSVSA